MSFDFISILSWYYQLIIIFLLFFIIFYNKQNQYQDIFSKFESPPKSLTDFAYTQMMSIFILMFRYSMMRYSIFSWAYTVGNVDLNIFNSHNLSLDKFDACTVISIYVICYKKSINIFLIVFDTLYKNWSFALMFLEAATDLVTFTKEILSRKHSIFSDVFLQTANQQNFLILLW